MRPLRLASLLLPMPAMLLALWFGGVVAAAVVIIAAVAVEAWLAQRSDGE